MIKLRDIFIILALLLLVVFIAKKGFAKDELSAVSVAELLKDTPRITDLKAAKTQKGDDTLIAEAKNAKNLNELQAVVVKLVERQTGLK